MIRRGEPWGVEVERPADLITVASDAELADRLAAGERRPLALSGGDLHRTLGSPRPPSGPTVRRVTLDLARVDLDGVGHLAVANVVARRPGRTGWWRGPLHGVFVASFLGDWDVAPDGHPNDGRVEVVEVDPAMRLRQRWEARRRLPTGAHLPHPQVGVTRRREVEWNLGGALEVRVDGRRRGRPHAVRVTVEPDAYELHL